MFFFENILGNLFFQAIGATIRWIWGLAIGWVTVKESKSFHEILSGAKGMKESDLVYNRLSNSFIGIMFLMAVIFLTKPFWDVRH